MQAPIEIVIVGAKLDIEDKDSSCVIVQWKDALHLYCDGPFETFYQMGTNPKWNEKFTLRYPPRKCDTIQFSVYRKKNNAWPWSYYGEASICLKDINTPSKSVTLEHEKYKCGEIFIDFPRYQHDSDRSTKKNRDGTNINIRDEPTQIIPEPNSCENGQKFGKGNNNENSYSDDSIISLILNFLTSRKEKDKKANNEISALRIQLNDVQKEALNRESQLENDIKAIEEKYRKLTDKFNTQNEILKEESGKLEEFRAELNRHKKIREEEKKKSINELQIVIDKWQKLEREKTGVEREKNKVEREKAGLEKKYSESQHELRNLEDEYKEEEKRAQKAESRLSNLDMKINEMSEKQKKNEEIILELRRRTGDLPSSDIEIGAYEYGGINPAIIDDHWRAMFKNLQQAITRAFKESNQQDGAHCDSMAAMEYRQLVYGAARDDKISIRLQSYVICRRLSYILVHFCRYTIVKLDGSVEISYNVDVVKSLAELSGNVPFSRREYAKEILNRLPRPDEINGKTTSQLFGNLSSPLQENFSYYFELYLSMMKNLASSYSIGTDYVFSSLVVFLYTALYATIQMSVISNNTITAYWSSSVIDRDLLGIRSDNFVRVPQKETLYNEVERVSLPVTNSKDQSPFVLFSVFPGCAHIDNSGVIKVISPSKVFCAEPE